MMQRRTGKNRRPVQVWWTICALLLIWPQSTSAHVFKLYAGTLEEVNEWAEILYEPQRLRLVYTGEYHGQLAPHIRFMMDTDQNGKYSRSEIRRFIRDYQQEWERSRHARMFNVDNIGYTLTLQRCTFPEVQTSNLPDPLPVTLELEIEGLRLNPANPTNNHLLEIQQQTLFRFGKVFIEMAQTRAAFTDEQVNAIARFYQVTIKASEAIRFTRCYPGSISRERHTIRGIIFDDASRRVQFSPYPKISATFTIAPPS